MKYLKTEEARKQRVGLKSHSKRYGEMELVEYFNYNNCTVRFVRDNTLVKKVNFKTFQTGNVKNPKQITQKKNTEVMLRKGDKCKVRLVAAIGEVDYVDICEALRNSFVNIKKVCLLGTVYLDECPSPEHEYIRFVIEINENISKREVISQIKMSIQNAHPAIKSLGNCMVRQMYFSESELADIVAENERRKTSL